MTTPRPSRVKAVAFRLVAVGLAVSFTLLVVELGIRVGYMFRHARRPNQIFVDEKLGWRPTPDLKTTYVKRGFGDVHYSTDSLGSRAFGDPETDRLRLLILGDSFTQAVQVSNGETYYDRLRQFRPDLEIFAYGVGGYGTLQQWMALDELQAMVRPDLVLLQFCENDFINNDAYLESVSSKDNNHMRRPYLEDGQVVYRNPDGWLGRLASVSYVARRAAVLLGSLRLRARGDISVRLDGNSPEFLRARATTARLLEQLVQTAGDAPVVAFYVRALGERDYRAEAFAGLCRETGLRCVPDLDETLLASRKAGVAVDGSPGDDHWNATGHTLAAERVLAFLEESGLLPAASPL